MEDAAFAQKVAAYEFAPGEKKKAKNNLSRLGVVTSGAEGMQNLKLYWVLRHQDDGDGALERIDKAKMDAAGAKLKRTARLLRTYYIVQRSRKPTLNSELPRDVFVDPAQFPDFPKNVRPDSIWLVDSCVSKTQLGPGVTEFETAHVLEVDAAEGDWHGGGAQQPALGAGPAASGAGGATGGRPEAAAPSGGADAEAAPRAAAESAPPAAQTAVEEASPRPPSLLQERKARAMVFDEQTAEEIAVATKEAAVNGRFCSLNLDNAETVEFWLRHFKEYIRSEVEKYTAAGKDMATFKDDLPPHASMHLDFVQDALMHAPCYTHLHRFVELFQEIGSYCCDLVPSWTDLFEKMVDAGATNDALDLGNLSLADKLMLTKAALYTDYEEARFSKRFLAAKSGEGMTKEERLALVRVLLEDKKAKAGTTEKKELDIALTVLVTQSSPTLVNFLIHKSAGAENMSVAEAWFPNLPELRVRPFLGQGTRFAEWTLDAFVESARMLLHAPAVIKVKEVKNLVTDWRRMLDTINERFPDAETFVDGLFAEVAAHRLRQEGGSEEGCRCCVSDILDADAAKELAKVLGHGLQAVAASAGPLSHAFALLDFLAAAAGEGAAAKAAAAAAEPAEGTATTGAASGAAAPPALAEPAEAAAAAEGAAAAGAASGAAAPAEPARAAAAEPEGAATAEEFKPGDCVVISGLTNRADKEKYENKEGKAQKLFFSAKKVSA